MVRFETLGSDERFSADVVFDRHGLVLDYPGIGRRIGASGGGPHR